MSTKYKNVTTADLVRHLNDAKIAIMSRDGSRAFGHEAMFAEVARRLEQRETVCGAAVDAYLKCRTYNVSRLTYPQEFFDKLFTAVREAIQAESE